MTAEPSSEDVELRLLLEAIFERFHYDFRGYSMASLKRRILGALGGFGVETISGLQERLLHDASTFPELLRHLTVQVSDLFRDPPYYRTLREKLVPELRTYPSLRFWVAGCSTGEEVYSMAILLKEEGLLERTQLYATDIHPESLRAASEGVFAIDRVATFTENHSKSGATTPLASHYTAGYRSIVFDRSLKKQIVFSDHSLATDQVFAEMQLISCRNVLIYFDRGLQERAIGLFKDALCRRGFLGLGAKETLRFTAHAPAFIEESQEHRWYRRR